MAYVKLNGIPADQRGKDHRFSAPIRAYHGQRKYDNKKYSQALADGKLRLPVQVDSYGHPATLYSGKSPMAYVPGERMRVGKKYSQALVLEDDGKLRMPASHSYPKLDSGKSPMAYVRGLSRHHSDIEKYLQMLADGKRLRMGYPMLYSNKSSMAYVHTPPIPDLMRHGNETCSADDDFERNSLEYNAGSTNLPIQAKNDFSGLIQDLYERKMETMYKELLDSKQLINLQAPSKKLPTEEHEYTDVFHQYLVDGLALKKEVVEKLQKVKGVESLGTGFSTEKDGFWPVIRVMADETTCNEIKQHQKQQKRELVHEVTAALHGVLTQLYTASWNQEELEKMIEIVINYPLKAFNTCASGEEITTTYNFSNQTATKKGRMAFSIRHRLRVGRTERVAIYHIGGFHSEIPTRSAVYRGVLDSLPVSAGQQTQVQYEMVHSHVAQITLTQPSPQEDSLLIHTALQATMYPRQADAGLKTLEANFAYTCSLQTHPLEFLHGEMGLFKQELKDRIPHKYKYILATANSSDILPDVPIPVYFRHQCNIDIGVLKNITNPQQDYYDLESLFCNLKAGEGLDSPLPSKINWCEPPEENLEDMKGNVVFVKDGMVHRLADKLVQVHSMEYLCCQWKEDNENPAVVPGVSGSPVFLQREDKFHLVGILITEQSATPVKFGLNIIHARIAMHHVQEVLDEMITTTYESDDRLEKYKKFLECHESHQSLLPIPLVTFNDLRENNEPLIPPADDGIISSNLEICLRPY